MSLTSGAGTFACVETTYARTQVSLPVTRRWRGSVTPCASACANSMPATFATQPAPTTKLPPATDGCDAESSVIAPQASVGALNTSSVADFDVIVADVEATRTAETSVSPVPVTVTGSPLALAR